MATTESAIDHPLRSDEHPERHEHSDLSVSALGVVFVAGVVVVVATLVGVYLMFWAFQTVHTYFDVRTTSITAARIEPREPRVQGIPGFHPNLPWQDTQEMKQQTSAALTGYGKTDDSHFIHIPIDVAMRQLVQDGSLKVRDNPQVPNQGALAMSHHKALTLFNRHWHFKACGELCRAVLL